MTKQLDTVTLVELRADTIEVYYLEPPILYYTKVDKRIVLYSSRFQKTFQYYTDLKNPFTSDFASILKNGYYFTLAPLERKLKFNTADKLSGVTEFYRNYSVNGVNYSNVSEIERWYEPDYNFEHSLYYFAPNIGLIKKKSYNESSMATKASGLRISNKVLFFGVTFLFGSFLLVCCKKMTLGIKPFAMVGRS